MQILPPKQNAGTLIGQGLGQGFAQGAQQANPMLFQRALIQQGLKQAGEMAKNPNVTPLERNLGFLSAFAAIHGSERYIDKVLPMLNQMAAFGEGQGGQGGQGGMGIPTGGMQGGQPSGQVPRMVGGQPVPAPTENAFPQEDIDLYEPFLGSNVKKYSPQEIQAVEYQDLSRGMPDSPRANFMRKQNQEIESAATTISQRQKDFADYYSAIHPNLEPDDQRIAQKFARTTEALKAPTNAEKARIVDNFVDRYRALRTNIANQNPRSLAGETRANQEKEQRNQIQWLLDEGQRDLAKEYLTKTLHWGDAESERIIKPPSEGQVNLLTKFEKLPELEVKVPEYGKATARQYQTYNKERSAALDKYEHRLEKAIQPGTTKNPGTSLLILRDLAKEAGVSWPEFNDRVNKLIAEKKITLDKYQTSELPKLTSPPVNGFWDMLIERR